MSPKGQEGESVTVLGWEVDKATGNVVGRLSWDATPEIGYSIEVSPSGVVVSFSARCETGVAARRLRYTPIGQMQRALRRDVVADLAGMLDESRPVYRFREGRLVEGPPRAPDHPARRAAEQLVRDFSTSAEMKYAAVASMYVELLDQGVPHPVSVLAERMHLAKKTISNYLFAAREKGLLTSAGQGSAGGQLTERARRLLRGEDSDDG